MRSGTRRLTKQFRDSYWTDIGSSFPGESLPCNQISAQIVQSVTLGPKAAEASCSLGSCPDAGPVTLFFMFGLTKTNLRDDSQYRPHACRWCTPSSYRCRSSPRRFITAGAGGYRMMGTKWFSLKARPSPTLSVLSQDWTRNDLSSPLYRKRAKNSVFVMFNLLETSAWLVLKSMNQSWVLMRGLIVWRRPSPQISEHFHLKNEENLHEQNKYQWSSYGQSK